MDDLGMHPQGSQVCPPTFPDMSIEAPIDGPSLGTLAHIRP